RRHAAFLGSFLLLRLEPRLPRPLLLSFRFGNGLAAGFLLFLELLLHPLGHRWWRRGRRRRRTHGTHALMQSLTGFLIRDQAELLRNIDVFVLACALVGLRLTL